MLTGSCSDQSDAKVAVTQIDNDNDNNNDNDNDNESKMTSSCFYIPVM